MANTKASLFLNLCLILALLLIVSQVEGRKFSVGLGNSTPQPECDAVFAVQKGNTCFEIVEAFKLTTEFFEFINPNLNCDALFVGQWVCVSGSV